MPGRSEAYRRFLESTEIDYEKWHDGIGNDLDALRALGAEELAQAEHFLLGRAHQDWRDLEGLLALGTPRAREAVVEQLRSGSLQQRLNAARRLDEPALLADREAAVVAGLRDSKFHEGLSVALDLATELRTPAMLEALFLAALRDDGDAAVHAAARLAFINGKAKDAFDWELRPLFLRFGTPDRAERAAAFRELAALCEVDPAPYLRRWDPA